MTWSIYVPLVQTLIVSSWYWLPTAYLTSHFRNFKGNKLNMCKHILSSFFTKNKTKNPQKQTLPTYFWYLSDLWCLNLTHQYLLLNIWYIHWKKQTQACLVLSIMTITNMAPSGHYSLLIFFPQDSPLNWLCMFITSNHYIYSSPSHISIHLSLGSTPERKGLISSYVWR